MPNLKSATQHFKQSTLSDLVLEFNKELSKDCWKTDCWKSQEFAKCLYIYICLYICEIRVYWAAFTQLKKHPV